MIDPLVLTLCPDGHLDGPRKRVIWPSSQIIAVRELDADPGDPQLARCEVLRAQDNEPDRRTGLRPWLAVAESLEEVAARMGAYL
jgi:hypothetical protein